MSGMYNVVMLPMNCLSMVLFLYRYQQCQCQTGGSDLTPPIYYGKFGLRREGLADLTVVCFLWHLPRSLQLVMWSSQQIPI